MGLPPWPGLLLRLSLLFLAAISTATPAPQWHAGCYHGNLTYKRFLDGDADAPVECGALCLKSGSQYAVVNPAHGCACLPTLPTGDQRRALSECTTRCQTGSAVPTRCGGPGVNSVYRTDGPYLLNVTARLLEGAVYTHQPMSIEVFVHFAGPPNMTMGLPGEVLDGQLEEVNMTIDFGTDRREHQLTAGGTTLHNADLYTFSRPGNYTINVRAANAVSAVSARLNVTVQLPLPVELQVAVVTSEQPSCVPAATSSATTGRRPHQKRVAVFGGETTRFQASVNMAWNLTFDWTFGDDRDDVTRDVPESYGCVSSACVTSEMSHIYKPGSEYQLTVTASNELANVSDTLYLVAVKRELKELSLTLEEGQTYISTPGSSINFVLSMITTDRQDTHLEVNFGDGDIQRYRIRDQHGKYLGLLQGASDQVALKADYGAGPCVLQLVMDHTYAKQNNDGYHVSARAWNNNSDVMTTLEKAIVIQSRLAGMRVQGTRKALVGRSYTFLVEFEGVTPVGVEYSWQVLSPSRTSEFSDVSGERRLSFTFTERGAYEVRLTATNHVNSDGQNFTVHVHQPILDLKVSLLYGGDPLIATGGRLSFKASISSGSAVEFQWDFADEDEDENVTDVTAFAVERGMTSYANHTFSKSGTYEIRVIAANAHDKRLATLPVRIVVQDPIDALRVTSDATTLLGNSTIVSAIVTGGNNVRLVLKYGDKRLERNNTHIANWSVILEVGMTKLLVIAKNDVSEKSQETLAEVQKPVGEVRVITRVDLVLGESVTFIAMQGSSVVDRPDLMYIWTVEGHVVAHTRTPVLERVFTGSVRNVVVIVKVQNKVSREEKKILFELNKTGPMRLTQGAIKEFGRPTNFTIVNLPINCLRIFVSYHRYTEKHSTDKHIQLPPNHSGQASWLYTFTTPGVYAVEVTPTPTGGVVSVIGVISVQRTIVNVSITGPSAVTLYGEGTDQTWEAVVDDGSHMLYEWSINGKHVIISPEKKFRHMFTTPGQYELAVNVSNSLGSQVTNRTVVAEHPLRTIRLTTRPVLSGDIMTVIVTVPGGPPRTLLVDMGDGKVYDLRSDNLTLQGEQVTNSTSGDDHGPTIKYSIKHMYITEGTYTVIANASNMVTSQTAQRDVRVEEPTTGLRVNATHGPIVELGTSVVITATVKTGKNLTFDWVVTPDVQKDSEPSGRSITLQLDAIGLYNVTVYVTHALDITSYVTASLPYLLSVVEPLAEVTLREENDRRWARFEPLGGEGRKKNAPVTFIAMAERGSHVTFSFLFGDGTSMTTNGSDDLGDYVTATVPHVFHKEGTYAVSVTAANPLGNVTALLMPFYVQTPPVDCRLHHDGPYVVPFGDDFTVNVTTSIGTDVMIDWDMGDQAEYKNRTGGVTHHYTRQGDFKLVAKCYNLVGSDQAEMTVRVVIKILGVQVLVSGGTQHPNAKNILFTAKLNPDLQGQDVRYSWDFGEPNDRPVDGNLPAHQHKYFYFGRYSVHVTAQNLVSRVQSRPVLVEVIEPLEAVELVMTGEPLLGHRLVFEAYHYKGSNVNYTWNFGDGRIINVTRQKVVHTYKKTGTYIVSVLASNLFGNQTASRRVFALESPCSTPIVNLLEGATGNQHGQNVTRGQEFKLETDVRINCSTTSVANYMWTLTKRGVNPAPVNLSGVPERVLTDPILFIPRYTLGYGSYDVTLRVAMNGTRVFAEAHTHFSVLRAHLLAVISGGLQRYTVRNETIVMDGSKSYDPDFPDSSKLNYSWTCYQLIRAPKPCFKPNVTLNFNTPILHLRGSDFVSNTSTFVFNLTVYRNDADRFRYRTSQVLKMMSHGILDMTLSCSECDDGLINSDQRLIVEARHPGILEDDLEYSWELYIVANGNDLTSDFHDPSYCVNADGSSYLLISPNTTTSTTLENTTPGNRGPAGSQVNNRRPGFNGTLTSTTTSGTKAAPSGGSRGEPEEPPLFEIGERSEGFSGRRSDSSGSSSGGHGAADPSPTPAGGSAAAGGAQASESPTEAHGNRRGSGSGLGPAGQHIYDSPDGRQNEAGGKQTLGGTPKPAVDSIAWSRSSPHIVSLHRSPIRIQPRQTTTGTHRSALVFNPNVLRQGRMYIIQSFIKHKVDGRNGTALTYVVVNQSPSQGQCTLSPDVGVEMDTVFKVICSDWKDQHLPIQYEISYSLENGSSRDLIYQGLNHETTFMLPAGNSSRNHTVLVIIAILDSYGARTTVCSLPVKVKVADITSGSLETEYLYGVVAKENSTLQTYVSKGDNRNARLHAHLVAHRLNRLHPNSTDSETSLRTKIRTSMLQTLNELPMRDEYEVQQMTSAVTASTAVSNELDSRSLDYASKILEKATERMAIISDVNNRVDSDIITMAIEGSSNIVAAASRAKGKVEVKKQYQADVTKPVMERTRWSIHNLTQTELSHTVLGEEPRKRVTKSFMTYAGRFRTSDISTIHVPNVPNFRLPSSLSTILEKNKVAGNHGNRSNDCYEMHIVTYKRNPFLYGSGRLKGVDSQVPSLSLFSCGGKELIVNNLPANDQIAMAIPHVNAEARAKASTFKLHKHMMQVHQLNVSLDPTDLGSIHILIELDPVSQGRLFPIALLLRSGQHPTPDRYQFKKVFPASAEKLSLFLPPHALNESTTYYLGVVDAHFNAARPRPGEVQQRQYTLRMWKAQCMYWDERRDSWSNRGCSIQSTSTLVQTDCLCRHLTAFGANNSLVPNELNFPVNIDDFFDLNENPVTFTLVICILALYFVLLVFCAMSDNHDLKKGAIVHLVDNSPSHVYTYVITMETGMRRGAGTSAKVSLVLHGKEGMSETRELVSELGQPLFERNSRDTFIITLPESMGQIWKVQLWHNNAGDSPNWYLSRVIVKDVNKGQTYYFSCEKWFAVEEEDGKVEREIMALDCGLGFAKVLWAKSTQYLTDYHLWFSMMVRPSYSRFTRAQRLTCCLTLLMSYMAVNAAWYKESHPEYRGEFGLIDLSWRAVTVGLITSLIVLPVNFLLVFIFRRSKIKKICIEDPPEKKYYPVKRDSVISLDSTVRLLQPAVTPSIFDQSMLNWQTLQDWAQRQWTKRYQHELEEQREEGSRKPEEAVNKPEYGPVDQSSGGFEDCLGHDHASPNPAVAADTDTDGPTHTRRPVTVTSQSASDDVSRMEGSGPEEKHRRSVDSELRRQHELDKYVLDSIRSNKPRRVFFPHACRYVAWVFAVIIIAGCSTITVLYGFRFGKTKSTMWLQSLFFSFMQCVFITHPLLVLAISVYTAIKYRNNLSIFDHHDDGVIEQRTTALLKSRQPNRDVDEDLAMGIAVRQRSRYLHYARPPQEKQLIEARKKIMKEKKATSVLSESVGVVILIVLLFFIAYSKDISTPFRLNTVLKDLLTKTGSQPFHSLKTVQEWHQWSRTDMLDALYWEKWYNGQHTNHDKGYVGNSAILGTISLRQLRVRSDRCRTVNTYGIMTALCYHNYYYGNHDVTPYGANRTWRFYESNVTRATGLEGRHAHYDGSGYQIILPKTRQYAYELMEGLEEGGWIDRNTRGVVVEFTLYNAPTKLFSSVTLLLELAPGGGVSSMARVSSVHLFRYTSNFDNFVLACELLLVVVTLYKLHCEVGELAWYRKAYFRNPWKTSEATVLFLLLAFIACYIYRFVLVYEAVELMRATYHEEYVDVAYIAYWDEVLRSLLGFIILLVIVQSLRLFRNRKVFAKFGGVYRKAWMDLLYLALMMMIWVCAYTCLGYAVYGSISYNFSQVGMSLTTVLAMLTSQHGVAHDVTLLDRAGAQLFLVSFLLLVIGSLTAYIVAVLTFHYRTYHEEGLPSLTTMESLTYFWTKLLQMTGFAPTSGTPEAEKDPTMIPAEFRMAAIETQVDEMLFKMNSLTGGSSLPEKPPMYFTDSDGTYGTYSAGDDGLSSGGSEVRAFDEDRFEHRRQKIENNLIANEPHLAQLLKLDAIGAKVLSQERENQLRSALEFEIFRQLQVQRRNSADVRSLPSDNGQVVIHRLSSLSGSASSSGGASSTRGSPISPVAMRHSRELLCRTHTEMDVLSMRSVRSVRSRSSRDHGTHPPSRGSRQSLSMTDALVLQDGPNYDHILPALEAIPLQEIARKSPRLGRSPDVAVVEEEGAIGGEVQSCHLEDPVSSCSSGGAEVRYIVGQGQEADDCVRIPALTSSNTTICSSGSNLTAGTVKSAASIVKPKSASSTSTLETGSSKSTLGNYEYTDTSSGSEHDASLWSSPGKARSLRKTKSRGKGKGRCRLTPVDGGKDKLGMDNKGYTSESDHDLEGSGSNLKSCKT